MKAQLNILDSMIFSKMRTYVMDKLGTKYSLDANNNFSTIKNEPTDANFPFVSFLLISATETSNDLEATSLNGGLFTYQVVVYDNQSQYRAKEIMDSVTESMKSMAFKSTSLPINASDGSTFSMIARFQRYIDEGDDI